jgi:16S rRNA (cytosine1402-N4)-methyltransferase
METPPTHIPVLRDEVLRLLNPQPGETYFDGTAGYGGHAAAVLERIGPSGAAILVDRDADAVKQLSERFKSGSEIMHDDYASTAEQLRKQGRNVDMVLLDLGVSSPQLDVPERGFSFRSGGPLDMRMDQSTGRTAADIVNTMGERELADTIYEYGEDRKSRRIARAIVAQRPFTTTAELANTIAAAVGHHEDIHPATRTFQALRIVVNDELGQLRTALPILGALLKPGGRIAVISFHSLEDRIVKDFFRFESRDCICPPEQPICTCDHVAILKVLTPKPILGIHDRLNPRARSAKLRAAVKLTPKQKENKYADSSQTTRPWRSSHQGSRHH